MPPWMLKFTEWTPFKGKLDTLYLDKSYIIAVIQKHSHSEILVANSYQWFAVKESAEEILLQLK